MHQREKSWVGTGKEAVTIATKQEVKMHRGGGNLLGAFAASGRMALNDDAVRTPQGLIDLYRGFGLQWQMAQDNLYGATYLSSYHGFQSYFEKWGFCKGRETGGQFRSWIIGNLGTLTGVACSAVSNRNMFLAFSSSYEWMLMLAKQAGLAKARETRESWHRQTACAYLFSL